jgi:hypothetical protein
MNEYNLTENYGMGIEAILDDEVREVLTKDRIIK